MGTQLESEQGDLSKYTEKQAKFSAMKADLEAELSDASKKLAMMESARQNETSNKKALEQQNISIKKDIEDLELAVQKLEQEKCNRDYIMRQINDEIASQDEIINKLNKEKKHVGENNCKATEDLQAAEDKVNHLNNIKSKLEQTMDQLVESYEKEKGARADIEKQRRKKEGELKIAQETVADLERSKKELESSIARKEKDISDMSGKLEDEQCIVGKMQKGIKETQARVEELEEELEAERQARAKAERQRSDLARELEQLGERLNEAGGVTAAQRELNKKREAEVQRMRKDLEEAAIQQEATMTNLKRKHQDAVAEMSEQIDQLSKMKGKIEKDRNQIMHEISDVRAATDEIGRSKASAEKANKTLVNTLNESNKRVEEANLNLGEYENNKRKIAAENSDLLRSLQELENSASMLGKIKVQLSGQLDEVKRVADDEAKERHSLLGKYKNLEHALDGMREQMDEESSSKDDVLRQLNKAAQEGDMWRLKYEKEAVAKAEERKMTNIKRKVRHEEAQGTIEQMQAKLAQLERSRDKLQVEIDEVSQMADQAHLLNNSMEKKARQFEKIVGEWKAKADGLSYDLDVSQKE